MYNEWSIQLIACTFKHCTWPKNYSIHFLDKPEALRIACYTFVKEFEPVKCCPHAVHTEIKCSNAFAIDYSYK